MLINGKPGVTIAAEDRGFHYGDGLFETIRISNRQPVLWTHHLRRLEISSLRLGIPLEPPALQEEAMNFLAAFPGNGILKIIITRGSGGRGYKPPESPVPTRYMQFFPLADNYGNMRERGAALQFCRHVISSSSSLAGVKHLNRLDQVLASREIEPGIDEGLMLDEGGHVIEGIKTNIFVGHNERLFTPDLSYAGVNGVMREYLLDCFGKSGLAVQIKPLKKEDIFQASEIFLCNSVYGVWPATSLLDNKRKTELTAGNLTRQALAFQDKVF